ncbi:MAG: PAS domain S-box protein [Desulfobacteraceae bacterium]|jgi:PAS domain S-box-containing protein
MSTFEEFEQAKSSHHMAEEKLRESEKRFSIIFNTNPAAIALARLANSQLMDVNKAWRDMTGYTHSEAVGHTAVELNLWVVPKQRDQMVKMLRERGVARDEVQVRRKSGEIIEVLMSAEIIELSGENYLLTMAQDITERKRAEKALRESETKYRSMMEAFADPLYICSPDFIVEYMNPAMVRRTGRDATGEKCHHALHGLDAKCDLCVFDKVARGEKIETTIKSPLDERNFRITHMPIHNQDGTISKMTILRDITDYLQAVSEKETAQAQLLQARKMESIGNLAGGIAHDFNNILASILGFTELALEEVSKGTTLEQGLQEVYSAGARAKDLVKQILSFARQSDEKRSPLIPSKIVKEVLKFIRSATPTTIEIRQDIESDALIMGNATQVHQVLMNLCTNAAHVMEDTGGILGGEP